MCKNLLEDENLLTVPYLNYKMSRPVSIQTVLQPQCPY